MLEAPSPQQFLGVCTEWRQQRLPQTCCTSGLAGVRFVAVRSASSGSPAWRLASGHHLLEEHCRTWY